MKLGLDLKDIGFQKFTNFQKLISKNPQMFFKGWI